MNILTKDRCELLKKALLSVEKQSFQDYEVVLVDDGSSDGTSETIEKYKNKKIERLKIIRHEESRGITTSRQEALEASGGEYIAVLDDDDEWTDVNKLEKQVRYLEENRDYVLVGGGIEIEKYKNKKIEKLRPETDKEIRRTMLFRNNFFTSTVMFRKEAAIKAGGFLKDQDDFAEDYDLWLRLGKIGKMRNFHEIFTAYRQPGYNKERFKSFLEKQLNLIKRNKEDYPSYRLASLMLKIRFRLGK